MLVANRERVVTKEEINKKVWRGRVASKAALSSRIKTARQALGDNGRDQQVIRTIHKKGFRFVACVDSESLVEEALDAVGSPKLEVMQPSQLQLDIKTRYNKPAIAVLPFANLSREAEHENFSDGISSDIITFLSKHRWLNVTARNTTFGYKGKTVNIKQLGEDLQVNYVVEGSVQRAGNRVRISANLIDAASGHQKWGERYDREIADIFSLQDEITEMIVARLEPEIGFSERNKVIHSRPANLQS